MYTISAAVIFAVLSAIIFLNLGFLGILIVPLLYVGFLSYKHPFAAIWSYLFLLPFCPNYIGIHVGILGDLTAIRLLNVVFLLPVAIRHLIIRLYYQKSNISSSIIFYDVLMWIFVSLSMIGSSFNFGFNLGKAFLLFFIDYFPIYFVITRMLSKRCHFTKMANVLIISGLSFLSFGVVDYLLQTDLYTRGIVRYFPELIVIEGGIVETFRSNINRMQLSFGQPLAFGMYCVLLHMIIIFSFNKTDNIGKKFLYIITFSLALVGLLISQARGPFLVDCFLLIICFISILRTPKILVIGLIAIIGIILFFNINSNITSTKLNDLKFENLRDPENANLRLGLIKEIGKNISKMSLVGENRELFRSLDREYQEDTVIWYVQVLVDSGLITLIVLLLMLGSVVFYSMRACIANNVMILYGYSFAFLSILLCFLEISFVGHIKYFFWLALAINVCLIVNQQNLFDSRFNLRKVIRHG